MGNLSDPAFLSALSGVLLAAVQLLRLIFVAVWPSRSATFEGGDTPTQGDDAAVATPAAV